MNGFRTTECPVWKTGTSFLVHLTQIKINLKCNTDLNVKAKAIELAEKKLSLLWIGRDSLEYKEMKHKRKNGYIVLHQNDNILLFKRDDEEKNEKPDHRMGEWRKYSR